MESPSQFVSLHRFSRSGDFECWQWDPGGCSCACQVPREEEGFPGCSCVRFVFLRCGSCKLLCFKYSSGGQVTSADGFVLGLRFLCAACATEMVVHAHVMLGFLDFLFALDGMVALESDGLDRQVLAGSLFSVLGNRRPDGWTSRQRHSAASRSCKHGFWIVSRGHERGSNVPVPPGIHSYTSHT